MPFGSLPYSPSEKALEVTREQCNISVHSELCGEQAPCLTIPQCELVSCAAR